MIDWKADATITEAMLRFELGIAAVALMRSNLSERKMTAEGLSVRM